MLLERISVLHQLGELEITVLSHCFFLVPDELSPQLRELSEKVGLDGLLKESILGLLAVLIHYISHD